MKVETNVKAGRDEALHEAMNPMEVLGLDEDEVFGSMGQEDGGSGIRA